MQPESSPRRLTGVTARIGAVLGLAALLILPGCGGRADATVGELVGFDTLGESAHTNFLSHELADGEQPQDVLGDLGGAEITPMLPLEPGFRRFAFIDSGCKHDSAQLVMEYGREDGKESGEMDAQLLEDGSTEQRTMCAAPVYFLSVFDVSVLELPDRLI